MKKVAVLYIVLFLLASFAAAQVSDTTRITDTDSIATADSNRRSGDAFGFRLGAGPDRSGEFDVTWQKVLGRYRLEVDLGWAQCDKWGYLNVSTAFHFHWKIVKGLAWYVGPGINMGWYFGDYHFGLGVGAQLGIEYNFDFPIQFSIDIFPRYNILGASDAVGLGGSGALSVRYRF
ncbi:MAG: hypothetical protein J5711_06155 [Bacteroidales bacterium]|nr:hypothetical protein [Bacteroidales bacterium]